MAFYAAKTVTNARAEEGKGGGHVFLFLSMTVGAMGAGQDVTHAFRRSVGRGYLQSTTRLALIQMVGQKAALIVDTGYRIAATIEGMWQQ